MNRNNKGTDVFYTNGTKVNKTKDLGQYRTQIEFGCNINPL